MFFFLMNWASTGAHTKTKQSIQFTCSVCTTISISFSTARPQFESLCRFVNWKKKCAQAQKKNRACLRKKKDKNINATCIRYVHRWEHGKNVNKGTHKHYNLCCCHRSTFIQRDRNRIEYVRWTWISMTHFVRSAVCARVTPPLPPHCRWMLFFFLLFESTDWNWSRK